MITQTFIRMKNLFSVALIICILIPLNSSAQSGRIKKRKKAAKKITPVTKKIQKRFLNIQTM